MNPPHHRKRLLLLLGALLFVSTACSQTPPGPHDKPGPSASSGTGSGSPSSPGAPSSPGGGAPRPVWHPKPGVDWQWQLTGKLDLSVDAPVYDIDGFREKAATVADLHKRGRKAICYISVGAYEDFRPDASRFPKDVIGEENGWEGEKWLDIRRLDVLRPLMAKRFDMCREKGFDAVEPDNVDGYKNDTGFDLEAADQLAFNRMIAKLAHDRGMSVGLKNDLDQIPQLVGDFDFAVNEQCAQYDECAKMTPFIKAGKAVFHVEYELPAAKFCASTNRLGLSSLQKRLHLDAWRKAC
ncbi:endo alpha-1,4 polygalactosaminidase [Streptomyces chrestomyceticus JCM 4735]|uniref:Endo alpha-1,4 polygalactosaminidase n=1 Tax=Streptomyces chrestomyceticus JCM 4735 TaxID=1306181 RepID=A0A7U9Q084_9ACTN|nr:endo alpha-1,4 polygalactosaminidase [Streptomyces chrestomyceticus]GCD38258.1 endo alpha-1,4 polygalactosaminidase [Streptomyces chrestomyceticus JCM 4735]